MNTAIWTAIGAIGGAAATVTVEYLKQHGVAMFATGEMRKAIRAEMRGAIATLNFRLLEAFRLAESGADAAAVAACFQGLSGLKSVELYVSQKREQVMKLSDWPLVEGWSDRLGKIAAGPHHPLFNAIMLFESFNATPSMKRYLDWGTRRFVKQVLARPEVQRFMADFFRHVLEGGQR